MLKFAIIDVGLPLSEQDVSEMYSIKKLNGKKINLKNGFYHPKEYRFDVVFSDKKIYHCIDCDFRLMLLRHFKEIFDEQYKLPESYCKYDPIHLNEFGDCDPSYVKNFEENEITEETWNKVYSREQMQVFTPKIIDSTYKTYLMNNKENVLAEVNDEGQLVIYNDKPFKIEFVSLEKYCDTINVSKSYTKRLTGSIMVEMHRPSPKCIEINLYSPRPIFKRRERNEHQRIKNTKKARMLKWQEEAGEICKELERTCITYENRKAAYLEAVALAKKNNEPEPRHTYSKTILERQINTIGYPERKGVITFGPKIAPGYLDVAIEMDSNPELINEIKSYRERLEACLPEAGENQYTVVSDKDKPKISSEIKNKYGI